MLANDTLVPLTDLARGETAVIREFRNQDLMLKLLEMGVLPGETVTLELRAPLGDPLSIRVSGYLLSIRKSEARSILVQKLSARSA